MPLSAFANFGIRAIVGLKVKDATTGFKAFRAEALEAIDFDKCRCKGFGFQAEVAYACQRRGHSVVEFPITFYDRAKGESKLSLGIILEALWRLFLVAMAKKDVMKYCAAKKRVHKTLRCQENNAINSYDVMKMSRTAAMAQNDDVNC